MIIIKEPIYNSVTYFTSDYVEYKKFVEKKYNIDVNNTNDGLTIYELDKLNVNAIYVKKGNNFFSILTHETSHAAFNILTQVGIILNKESIEAFAYLQEFLVRSIIRKLKKNY